MTRNCNKAVKDVVRLAAMSDVCATRATRSGASPAASMTANQRPAPSLIRQYDDRCVKGAGHTRTARLCRRNAVRAVDFPMAGKPAILDRPAANESLRPAASRVGLPSAPPIVVGGCEVLRPHRKAPRLQHSEFCEFLDHCSPPLPRPARRGERNVVSWARPQPSPGCRRGRSHHVAAASARSDAPERRCHRGYCPWLFHQG